MVELLSKVVTRCQRMSQGLSQDVTMTCHQLSLTSRAPCQPESSCHDYVINYSTFISVVHVEHRAFLLVIFVSIASPKFLKDTDIFPDAQKHYLTFSPACYLIEKTRLSKYVKTKQIQTSLLQKQTKKVIHLQVFIQAELIEK